MSRWCDVSISTCQWRAEYNFFFTECGCVCLMGCMIVLLIVCCMSNRSTGWLSIREEYFKRERERKEGRVKVARRRYWRRSITMKVGKLAFLFHLIDRNDQCNRPGVNLKTLVMATLSVNLPANDVDKVFHWTLCWVRKPWIYWGMRRNQKIMILSSSCVCTLGDVRWNWGDDLSLHCWEGEREERRGEGISRTEIETARVFANATKVMKVTAWMEGNGKSDDVTERTMLKKERVVRQNIFNEKVNSHKHKHKYTLFTSLDQIKYTDASKLAKVKETQRASEMAGWRRGS